MNKQQWIDSVHYIQERTTMDQEFRFEPELLEPVGQLFDILETIAYRQEIDAQDLERLRSALTSALEVVPQSMRSRKGGYTATIIEVASKILADMGD